MDAGERRTMSSRPPLISRLAIIRNRVLNVALRPVRWFSAVTQLVVGFVTLTLLTTLLLARWPLTLRTVGVLVLVLASYFIVWRFVDYRTKFVDLFISKRRAFALVGSAILVETALIRLGFIVAGGLAAQSTRAPLNDLVVWSFAIPFAAASLLVTMLLDRQLGLLTGVVASVFVTLLAPNEVPATLYALISCSAAAYGIRQYRERQSVTLAGLVVGGVNCLAAPDHFVENQMGSNPHDRLRPTTSAKIITSHVSYGLRLAKEIGLPQQVADFIPQHHGTRTLHFFLRKAQQQATNGEVINEADFRYPGPKPQFKETAILMLADSCEAAARSLAHPDPESIRAIVARIFDAILTDGQLDESNLTLRELTGIREALINSLTAIYHPRIDYPGFNVPQMPIDPVERNVTGVTYETPADVPINPSGEVEDEAITRSADRR